MQIDEVWNIMFSAYEMWQFVCKNTILLVRVATSEISQQFNTPKCKCFCMWFIFQWYLSNSTPDVIIRITSIWRSMWRERMMRQNQKTEHFSLSMYHPMQQRYFWFYMMLSEIFLHPDSVLLMYSLKTDCSSFFAPIPHFGLKEERYLEVKERLYIYIHMCWRETTYLHLFHFFNKI